SAVHRRNSNVAVSESKSHGPPDSVCSSPSTAAAATPRGAVPISSCTPRVRSMVTLSCACRAPPEPVRHSSLYARFTMRASPGRGSGTSVPGRAGELLPRGGEHPGDRRGGNAQHGAQLHVRLVGEHLEAVGDLSP